MTNYKKYEELTFADDFMFGKVTEDKEISRELLECLLQKEIGNLEDVQNQKEYKYAYEGKKIRIDLYSKDMNNIYDAEMQHQNHRTIESLELPKRSHYYHSMIAVDQLDRGDGYGFLENSNVIFICTFDPFGVGEACYHFSMREEQDTKLELNDGVHSYFFNATYVGDDVPDGIKNLYKYIQTGKVSDKLTQKIDKAVKKARLNSEWRSIYMKERIILYEERKAGREEGREEGVFDTLISLVKDGLLSISEAAIRSGKSEEELSQILKKMA